jgi:hypothetical protein
MLGKFFVSFVSWTDFSAEVESVWSHSDRRLNGVMLSSVRETTLPKDWAHIPGREQEQTDDSHADNWAEDRLHGSSDCSLAISHAL